MARTTGRKRFWFQQNREIAETSEKLNIIKKTQQVKK